MVHFASTELVWKYEQSLRCECMAPDHETPEDHKVSCRRSIISQNSKKFELWSFIVDTDTQRDITYDTDIFQALSGIANEMQSAGAGPYLAGVWVEDFPMFLLWDTQPWSGYGGRSERHVSPHIAPSWSWASPKKNTGHI
jgi:hypothetical protein